MSPDGALAYVTGYDSTRNVPTLSTVETVTGKFRGTVPLGINPYGVAVSPDGALVYVANSGLFQGTEPGSTLGILGARSATWNCVVHSSPAV